MGTIETILVGVMFSIGIVILEFFFYEMLSSNLFFREKKKGFISVLIIKLIVYPFLIYFCIRNKEYLFIYFLIGGIVIPNLILIYSLLATKHEQMYMIFKEFEKHNITFDSLGFRDFVENNQQLFSEEEIIEDKLAQLKRIYYK